MFFSGLNTVNNQVCGVSNCRSFITAVIVCIVALFGVSGCSSGLFEKTRVTSEPANVAVTRQAPEQRAPVTTLEVREMQHASAPEAPKTERMVAEEEVTLPEFQVSLVSAAKKSAAAKTATLPATDKKAPTPATRARARYNLKSVIAMDYTHRVILYEQDADQQIPPASLTKVLSMYVIMDAIKSGRVGLNDVVTVSQSAADTGGSHMGLKAGEKVTLHDLLMGMAVASGNDATAAAAQYVGGSEANFVAMMNRKAKALGMTKSVFKNVHGLPAPGQMTTARDMLTMTRKYVAAYPGVLDEYHSKTTIPNRVGYTRNSNPLLGHDGVDGLKTGYVRASGFNLITTVKRGDTRIIMVMLGAKNKNIRQEIAEELLETVCRPAPELAMQGALPPSAKKVHF